MNRCGEGRGVVFHELLLEWDEIAVNNGLAVSRAHELRGTPENYCVGDVHLLLCFAFEKYIAFVQITDHILKKEIGVSVEAHPDRKGDATSFCVVDRSEGEVAIYRYVVSFCIALNRREISGNQQGGFIPAIVSVLR